MGQPLCCKPGLATGREPASQRVAAGDAVLALLVAGDCDTGADASASRRLFVQKMEDDGSSETGLRTGGATSRDAELDTWLAEHFFFGERCATTVVARTPEESSGERERCDRRGHEWNGAPCGRRRDGGAAGCAIFTARGRHGVPGIQLPGVLFTAESERPEVAAAEIRNGADGPEIVLTPGPEAGAAAVAVEARVDGQPETEPAAAMVGFGAEVQATVPAIPLAVME